MSMKKNFIYYTAVFLFIAATFFIVLKNKRDTAKKEDVLLQLIHRKGNAQQAEWTMCSNTSISLMNKIKNNPADIKSLLSLTVLYLQEARASANYSYYDRAAMNCINRVLKKDAQNFEALTY